MNLMKTLRGKSLTVVQNLICATLIIVICLMSFGTIFTVSLNLNDEFKTQVTSTLSDLGSVAGSSIEIKDSIDVDFAFIVKSARVIFKVVKAASSTMNQMQQAASGESSTATSTEPIEFTEDMSQTMIDLVVFMLAILTSFKAHWLVGLCNIFLIAIAIALPITAILSTIKAVFALITNTDDPGKASHKISKAFYKILALFPMLLLALVFLPDVKFGGAVYGILVLCAIGLGVNLLVSRMKKYEGDDFKYLNLLQITSLVSVVGYVLFLVNIVKSELLNSVFSMLAGHAVNELVSVATSQKAEVDFVPFILTLILIATIYFVVNSLTKIVTRIACMSKTKSPASIYDGIVGLATVVIPFYMMNSMGLTLSDAQKGSFYLCVVGVVILLAVEIFLSVAPQKLCPNCDETRRQEIATGAYVYGISESADGAKNVGSDAAAEAVSEPEQEKV